ncbi:unnamed protein product, partial [Effrenium voratum]
GCRREAQDLELGHLGLRSVQVRLAVLGYGDSLCLGRTHVPMVPMCPLEQYCGPWPFVMTKFEGNSHGNLFFLNKPRNTTRRQTAVAGEVTVTPTGGWSGCKATKVEAGDLVVFPDGMTCVWDVTKPIKKHYSFS